MGPALDGPTLYWVGSSERGADDGWGRSRSVSSKQMLQYYHRLDKKR